MTMTNDLEQLAAARAKFEAALDAAARQAEAHMGLADMDDLGLDEDSDEYEIAREERYEERYHCEVCVVREVADIVLVPVFEYLSTLETALGLLED